MNKGLKVTGIILFFLIVLFSLTISQAQEEIRITTYYPSPVGRYQELRAERMSVGAGYMGTVIPANSLIVEDRLDVAGNVILGDAGTDTLTFNASTLAIPNDLNVDTDTLFIDATNNRVGIGINAPVQPLHVVGNEYING